MNKNFFVTVCLVLFPLVLVAETIFVKADAQGNNDGSSWLDAYTDLQYALGVSLEGDEIWVAEGVYKPGPERENSFEMINGVIISGGFNGTETEFEQRNPVAHVTILSGDIGTEGDIADNSYHVVHNPYGSYVDTTAILDGFTITGGNADGELFNEQGGGMFNNGSSPLIRNCIFRGNTAINGGGVANLNVSNALFLNVIIEDNNATNGGAGMDNFSSSPILIDCQVTGNFAENYGGGMSNDFASPELIRCVFYGNSSETGGGLSNYTTSAPILVNCTFAMNYASGEGGGMWNGFSFPVVVNSIFWGNTPDEIDVAGLQVNYSNIEGGYVGEGNIDANPLFIDIENGNLVLDENSPCIDTGTSFFVLEVDTLLNLSPDKYSGVAPDMGAYEYADTGINRKEQPGLPAAFNICSVYPNPFNPSTTITIELPVPSFLDLKVFNITGQQVAVLASDMYSQGNHNFTFDGSNLSSGIYFIQATVPGKMDVVQRVLLMK